MNETDGLLAQAQVESEDNQQQEEQTISHQLPDTETVANDAAASDQSDEPEAERPEYLQPKFATVEEQAKAYAEIQKKFSQGKHKVPEQYDDTVLKNAGIPEDDQLADFVKSWAKENGVSQSAFEDLASQFISMSQLEAEQAQVSFEEEYKKLGPNADAIIKSMTDWASGMVRKGVWSEADFEEFKFQAGTAQGLRAWQKTRSYYGDKPIPVDVGPVDGLPSKEELMAMVGKPEYNSDPAYRAKVEKIFEQVYGKEEYSAI